MKKFFLLDGDCISDYSDVRDEKHLLDDKQYIEGLWSHYESYADSHFLEDARCHFQERFWEMYLGNTFLHHGFRLENPSNQGPEFYFELNNRRCWVEAITPNAGDGADAVPNLIGQGVQVYPEQKIVLRFTHAIAVKYKEYKNNLKKGIIREDDFYILAINSKKIRPFIDHTKLPVIVKSVYPFGNLELMFDKNSNDMLGVSYQYRDSIKKVRGTNIATDIFMTDKFSGISALIYSKVNFLNKPDDLGSDFVLVHNKMAKNPVPLGSFNFGTEFWVENNNLKSRKVCRAD